MDLFKTLAGILSGDTDITIVVRKTGADKLIVSTNLCNRDVEDPAKGVIAPFVVSGTPDELDAGYAALITEPLEQSSGLQTSMKNFEASAKAAKAASKAAAEVKQKEDSAKRETKNAITKLLSEADALFKQKKYRQAKAAYEKAASEAEKADLKDELKKAQAGIAESAKKEVPDIFGAFDMDNDPESGEDSTDTDDESPTEDGDPETEDGDPEPGEEPEEEENPSEDHIDPLKF